MQWNTISRRHFLQGLGGLTLSLPFLASLAPRSALAEGASVPPKFLAMWTPHGGVSPKSFLSPTRPNIRVSSSSGHSVHYSPLTESYSEIITSSFNQFLPQMSVLEGLDVVQYLAHQHYGLLGDLHMDANAESPVTHIATIDQVLAYDSGFYPTPPPIRSISVNPTGSESVSLRWTNPASRTGATQEVSSMYDPQALYNSIFGTGNSGTPQDSSIVDAVYADYRSLRSNPRISRDDQARLDEHLSYLADLRSRLASGASCSGVTRPNSKWVWLDPTTTNLRTVSQLLADVVVAALRCGMTRIATFKFDYLMALGDFHEVAHSYSQKANQEILIARHQWFAENVLLYLLRRMDAVTEANGKTLLENSFLMWTPENIVPHSNKSTNVVCFGSAGGRFACTGKHIDFSDRDTTYRNGYVYGASGVDWELRPGYLYNRFMSTILQTMGVPPERYEQPRTGDYSHGGYGPVYPTQSNWGGGMTSDYLLMNNFYPTQLANMNTPLPMMVA